MQKEKTIEALIEQMTGLARQQPVLVVFEDLHWADPTTLEMLDQLVDRITRLRVLVMLTIRPEFSPPWRGGPHVTPIALNRLDRRESAVLVDRITDGKALPGEVLDQIVAKTDGVPLFLEELTKAVLDSGLLRDEGERYVLTGSLVLLTVPATLKDSLMARLDRLAAVVKEVAQTGAAIGREFSYELLGAVTEHGNDKLRDALGQLVAFELVFVRGTPPEATYSFKHALVRDAAYATLLKSRRKQLHSSIARAIEERYPTAKDTQPEFLALHLTAAGAKEVAISYWHRAGELALRRMTLNEAVAHLNKGLELVGSLPASPENEGRELDLRSVLGPATMALRGWAAPEVAAVLEPALRLSKSLDRREGFLPVLEGLWVHCLTQGAVANSMRWVTEILDSAEDFDDEVLKVKGHEMALCSQFLLGHFREALRHADLLQTQYDLDRHQVIADLTNHDPMTTYGTYGGSCLWMLGYPDQAAQLRQAGIEHSRKRAQPFDLGFALVQGSHVCEYRGDVEEILACAYEAEQLGHTYGIPFISEVLVPMFNGIGLLRAGRVEEGTVAMKAGVGLYQAAGGRVELPYFNCILAEAMALSGDLTAALVLAEESIEQAERPGWEERHHLAETLRVRGWILQQQGKLDEAEKDFMAAIDLAREQQAKSWELRTAASLACLWREHGRRAEAHDLLAPVYGWFTEGFGTPDLKDAKALLDDLL